MKAKKGTKARMAKVKPMKCAKKQATKTRKRVKKQAMKAEDLHPWEKVRNSVIQALNYGVTLNKAMSATACRDLYWCVKEELVHIMRLATHQIRAGNPWEKVKQ